jgi:hypothetical protein
MMRTKGGEEGRSDEGCETNAKKMEKEKKKEEWEMKAKEKTDGDEIRGQRKKEVKLTFKNTALRM